MSKRKRPRQKPPSERKAETHVFHCGDRTFTVKITEQKDRVLFDETMDKPGWTREEDFQAFMQWMEPLVSRYGNDPRPIVHQDARTGKTIFVGGDENQARVVTFAGSGPLYATPPRAPCPKCGSVDFIVWTHQDDPENQAISCKACGEVVSSTYPLAPDDRPRRRPAS